MKLDVIKNTNNKNFLKITECTKLEYEYIKTWYTKQMKNWQFLKKKYSKGGNNLWDGKITYYKGAYLPAGSVKFLKNCCSEANLTCQITDLEKLFDMNLTEDMFYSWCDDFFSGSDWTPRYYQKEAAFKILKTKQCLAQLATSAGKTLITFIVFAYLLDHKLCDRILMIVPNVSLVVQGAGDFEQYNSDKLPINIQQVYSGMKIKDDTNIVIGTYQSLCKLDKGFFDTFNCVMADEVHTANSKSIISILDKCEAEYTFGLSGTIPSTKYCDGMNLVCNFGPIVVDVKAKELQDQEFISTCEITQLYLDYLDDEQKNHFKNARKVLKESDQSKKMFDLEKQFIVDNERRLYFVIDCLSKVSKNTLVLFHHVEYGKKIFKLLKQRTSKQIYYIDGAISKETREEIKKRTEIKNDVILVASFGTTSTGVSINNLSNLFLVESFKSPTIVLQSIGRLLRRKEDINKTHAIIYDLVDCLYPSCFMIYHGKERKKLYDKQEFPVEVKTIKF